MLLFRTHVDGARCVCPQVTTSLLCNVCRVTWEYNFRRLQHPPSPRQPTTVGGRGLPKTHHPENRHSTSGWAECEKWRKIRLKPSLKFCRRTNLRNLNGRTRQLEHRRRCMSAGTSTTKSCTVWTIGAGRGTTTGASTAIPKNCTVESLGQFAQCVPVSVA